MCGSVLNSKYEIVGGGALDHGKLPLPQFYILGLNRLNKLIRGLLRFTRVTPPTKKPSYNFVF